MHHVHSAKIAYRHNLRNQKVGLGSTKCILVALVAAFPPCKSLSLLEEVYTMSKGPEMNQRERKASYDPERVSVADRLREMRLSAHETQKEWSKRFGEAQGVYASRETGRRGISTSFMLRLCHDGWNLNYLVAGVGPLRWGTAPVDYYARALKMIVRQIINLCCSKGRPGDEYKIAETSSESLEKLLEVFASNSMPPTDAQDAIDGAIRRLADQWDA